MEKKQLYPIFHYTEDDFHLIINNNDENLSRFDDLIIKKWKEAEENHIFRYKLKITHSKRLQGNYQFLAQLNLDRAQNRRRPEDIQSMKMPFNPNFFNFTKINSQEILFDLDKGDGNNVIIINASPIEFGHCLFTPERLECLPQVVTEFSLIKIIELMLLSKSCHLRAVFNSLCAHASVNHLHWHLYYLKHEMLLEKINVHPLNDQIFMIRDYPAIGFCLKLSKFENNLKLLTTIGFIIINYLQEHEIAHNVFITRAKSSLMVYDDLRIYIWARKSSTGVKDTKEFIPACCELFGHLSVRSEEYFRCLTEPKVEDILKDVVSDSFSHVLDDIIELTK